MPLTKTITVPDLETDPNDQRLWIGNLDTRITEYYLLKLLQKHGTIEKFDMLFHRSGPLAGQPRGYAFVTYASKDTAEEVRCLLDGKKMGSKYIAVRWAHSINKDETKDNTEMLKAIPALTGASSEKKLSRTTTIQAIEAKLKMMEDSSNKDFKLNIPSASGINSSHNKDDSKLPKDRRHTDRKIDVPKDRHKPYNKIMKN